MEIKLNDVALSVLINDAREEGVKEGIKKAVGFLNGCLFVEQGVTVKGDDISLYVMQRLLEEENE
jgi:hypothetical protein